MIRKALHFRFIQHIPYNIVLFYVFFSVLLVKSAPPRVSPTKTNSFIRFCVYGFVHNSVVLWRSHSQAVDHRASIASVILLLPLGQSSDQLQDGAFGQWCVSVRWPTNELEMLDQPVAVLRLEAEQEIF